MPGHEWDKATRRSARARCVKGPVLLLNLLQFRDELQSSRSPSKTLPSSLTSQPHPQDLQRRLGPAHPPQPTNQASQGVYPGQTPLRGRGVPASPTSVATGSYLFFSLHMGLTVSPGDCMTRTEREAVRGPPRARWPWWWAALTPEDPGLGEGQQDRCL